MNRAPKLIFYMVSGTILYPIVLVSAMFLQFTMWFAEPVMKLFDKCINGAQSEWDAIIKDKEE